LAFLPFTVLDLSFSEVEFATNDPA